jgi:hypothetical protein
MCTPQFHDLPGYEKQIKCLEFHPEHLLFQNFLTGKKTQIILGNFRGVD